MTEMNYQAKKDLYSVDKLFYTLYIDLNLTDTVYDDFPIYSLEKIKIDDFEHKNQLLKQFRNEIKFNLSKLHVNTQYSEEHASWSVFYTFKEILDQILSAVPEGYTPYYRGQAGDWTLQPTIFREGTSGYSNDFRKSYEHVYKNIAQKYPEDVAYFAPDDKKHQDDRAANLAELQHYGLGTPLIDISENPFISLLFMVDGYIRGNEPQLDVFFVRNNGKNTLFQQVMKKAQNRRIAAQKGAFLNFDRWDGNESEKVMPRLCIRLKYKPNLLKETDSSIFPDGENKNSSSYQEDLRNKALETAVNDIKNKLNSYYYRTEDLFPDFYMYLGIIKRKYSDDSNLKDNSKWYQVSDK